MTQDIKSCYIEELQALMEGIGEKPYRGKQLFSWLHEKNASRYEEMTNLGKGLQEKLKEAYPLVNLSGVKILESKQDGTKKFLFKLPDENLIESVLMRYKYGNSVCISSQVGCNMGCVFCASGIGGKIRNLAASEMLEQVYEIKRSIGENISHVVVMGTGEPLDNYDNLIRFIRILGSPEGMNMSIRNITVSTCGIVEGIEKLSEEGLPVTLAVSLHSAIQEKRKQLMPVANRYSVDQVIMAAKEYYEITGRRVTFEYALIKGVNDSSEDARALIRVLKGFPAHVNLIPINKTEESEFRPTDNGNILAFKNKLEKNGINGTIRRELGSDIQSACGQLRRRKQLNEGEQSEA